MKKVFTYQLITIKKLNIILVFVLICNTALVAQEKSSATSNQIWLDYNPGIQLKEGLKLYTPVGLPNHFPKKVEPVLCRSIYYLRLAPNDFEKTTL